jgi:4-hydroxymandelate oxidase
MPIPAPPPPPGPAPAGNADDLYAPWIDPAVTWRTIRGLAESATVPLVVKGVLRPDDARRAVDCGAAAVMVSNHGGRNLDTTVATVDAIAPVAAAVAGDVPVLVDGGIRRGTDIVKALALGATAVGIGRPYVWGLGVGGEDGVRDVVRLLRREFETAMALSGAPTLADLTPDLVLPP